MNIITVLLTLSCIGVLLLTKYIIEPKLKKCSKFHFPIPTELIVVSAPSVIERLDKVV